MVDRPKDLDDITKNPRLSAAFLDYLEAARCEENYAFYLDKGNVKHLYETYLGPDARTQVNLSWKVEGRIKALKEDFKNSEWKELIQDCKEEVKELVERDHLRTGKFYDSEQFAEYVKSKMGDPRQAARLLGIKNVKVLEAAMLAVAMGNRSEGEKLIKKLVKEEHMKEEVAAVRKALESYGFH